LSAQWLVATFWSWLDIWRPIFGLTCPINLIAIFSFVLSGITRACFRNKSSRYSNMYIC